MKNNYYFIFLFLALGCLAGCSTPIYMYAPAAENIPATTQKGEGTFTASYPGRGLDLQGNYALGNHLGVFADWYFRNPADNYYYPANSASTRDRTTRDRVTYHRHQFSFGGFYYTSLDYKKRFYLSLLGGYGIGHLSIKEHHYGQKYVDSTGMIISSDTSAYYNAHIQRLIIQPAAMYASRNRFFKFIFTVRWSFIRHTSVKNSFGIATTQLNPNKWYPFIEPTYTFIFNPQDIPWLGFRMQFGVSSNTDVQFDYRGFVGGVGLVIYPYKWWKR